MEETTSQGIFLTILRLCHLFCMFLCSPRYDYEECETDGANKLMENLESLLSSDALPGKSYTSEGKTYVVDKADNFSYVDPIDKSVAKNQVNKTGLSQYSHK